MPRASVIAPSERVTAACVLAGLCSTAVRIAPASDSLKVSTGTVAADDTPSRAADISVVVSSALRALARIRRVVVAMSFYIDPTGGPFLRSRINRTGSIEA